MSKRSWWHVGLKPFLQMLATLAGVVLAAELLWVAAGGAAYRAVSGSAATPWWWPVGAAAFALAAYVLVVRFTQRRPVTELAARPALRELGAGVGLGVVLVAMVMAALVGLGAYKVTSGPGIGTVGPALAIAVGVGFLEELIIRGAIMTWLVAWLGGWGALAASSLLFGASHLANPGATIGGALAIALEAGVLLGAALFVTGRLWLAIGVHLGWNFAEGGIFGVSVSGNEVDGSVWSGVPVAGHDLLSGGAFGAEASPVAVVVCLAAAAPMLVLAVRRGRIPGPAWGARRGTQPGSVVLPQETPRRTSR